MGIKLKVEVYMTLNWVMSYQTLEKVMKQSSLKGGRMPCEKPLNIVQLYIKNSKSNSILL